MFKDHFTAKRRSKIQQFFGKTSSRQFNLDMQQSREEIVDGEKKKLMMSSMNSSQKASLHGGMTVHSKE